MPIDHVKLPVRDLERTRAVYREVLGTLGWRLVFDGPATLGFGTGPPGADEEPIAFVATAGEITPVHVAFRAKDEQTVDAFFAAGLAAHGRDNGGPGLRPYGAYYYAAFLLDPDGHNIEAVFHGAG